ncbi:hypothetical protein [Bradyrhizobium sp. 25ACV]
MFAGPKTGGKMLRGNERSILFFDLAMAPHPSDAPALPSAEFIPYLKKRQASDLCFQVIDNERRVIRLLALREIKLTNGAPAIALLFFASAIGTRRIQALRISRLERSESQSVPMMKPVAFPSMR